jgi:molybdenum cofactor cytidylyltransferase
VTSSGIAVRALLLAAGRGTRFGGDKLLAPLPDGTPLGVAALRNLQHAAGPAIAVVRPDDALLADAFRGEGATVVIAERADEGMGASLAAGLAAIDERAGVLVALADMPWIAPDTIARIADAIANGASIAAPIHRGRRGHPVGFAPSHRAALLALGGDSGAREIVAGSREVVLLDVDDTGIVRDVDHPDDIAG